jgi:N,N'-diacetyllegionaminate synthase
MLKKLQLSNAQHFELIEYCKGKKVSFFSTAFDIDSLVFLKELGLQIVKIPSGEITNLPYLRKAASLFKEVIISTGMSSLLEIKEALDVFLHAGISKKNITILHCNTDYPTPMSDVNLKAMLAIQKIFGVKVGYSDHTMGTEVPIAAVALGGTMIEKHFTLNRNLPGPDQLASLEPQELKYMVKSIRNIELAIGGSGLKEPSDSELKNIFIARKSIVAKTLIQKGDLFNEFNITTKRPGTGVSPMRWDEVIGKKACKDFVVDELIKLDI